MDDDNPYHTCAALGLQVDLLWEGGLRVGPTYVGVTPEDKGTE